MYKWIVWRSNSDLQIKTICWSTLKIFFFIWTASESKLDEIWDQLNNCHPNLKFTHKRFRENVSFLDVTVKVSAERLITNLYCKPTDGRQYLHFESYDHNHIKSSIAFSQALRMRRICWKKTIGMVQGERISREYGKQALKKSTWKSFVRSS